MADEERRSELDAAALVVAAQFAGGMTIPWLAEEWERGTAWVEDAIRRALLEYIPKRSGGLKPSRTELQAARRDDGAKVEELQPELPLPPPVPGRVFPARKVVGYAENGYRVGESHHNVRISDEMVDRIREMHEEGGKTVPEIADELGLPFNTVSNYCYYRRRATPATRFKRVAE